MYGPEAVCRSRVPLLAEMLLGPGDTLEAMVVSEPTLRRAVTAGRAGTTLSTLAGRGSANSTSNCTAKRWNAASPNRTAASLDKGLIAEAVAGATMS